MLVKRSLQRQFFAVLYDISARHTHAYLTLTILTAYLLELLLAYTALALPSHLIATAILHSRLLAICVVAGMAAVAVQLLLVFSYRLQLQLQLQLVILRFILIPMALLQLVAQTEHAHFLPAEAAFALLLPTLLMGYFCNFVLHSYWRCSMSRSFERASSYLVLTDALFIVARLPSRFLDLQALVVVQLVVHLFVRHKLVRYNLTQMRQHLQYYSMLLKDSLAVLYLAQRAYLIGGDALLLLLFSLPLLAAAMATELARKRVTMMEGDIFGGNAKVEVFLEEMERMGVELQRFNSNQDLDLQGSLLVVFVAAHSQNCTNGGCLLLQPSTEQEMRNCSQANSMKILKHKIVKKMEALFQLYDRIHHQSSSLKLHRLAFYVRQLPNKTKISLLQAALHSIPLSWHQQLALYGLERMVEGVEEGEQLGGAKGEEEFLEFKKLLLLAVGCFQEFWSHLVEERVDLRQLGGVSSRLFPLKQAIEAAWRRHVNRQQFSSWNVLRTYTYYRRNVLHDYTNSVILEDYCKIVEQRLKAKHEMSYINSATEQAVLAISLTESSLGNLASMNSQTCKLFSFGSKGEMLERRVNDIMPSVYSVVHDNILSSFLKNRFKNVNQDLRFVFGKNKNGFIFPFHLQLRKLSWSVNDELIFIAHLEPSRVRAAPIYCIADLEGDLQDYTSAFAWLFMKKAKDNREIKRKNIQEMIPSFFEVVEGSEARREGQRVRFHERSYAQKNGHNIEIEFWASELYIRAEKVGYLVEGTNALPLRTISDHNNISELLARWQKEGMLFINSYSPSTLAYQIPNKCEESSSSSMNEFTIPFLHTADIEGILRLKQQLPVYGKNIKTLRLLHGKLEHVIEEGSFLSDEDNFEIKEISVIKKIEKMRQQLSLEKSHPPPDHFRLILAASAVALTLLPLLALSRIPLFRADEGRRLQEMQERLQVRQLLPEYLISILYHSTPTSSQALRDQLQDSLTGSTIAEAQKEAIMRVIFEFWSEGEGVVEVGLLEWEWNEEVAQDGVVAVWWLVVGATLLFLLALAGIYLLFRLKMAEIYMVFVLIGEQKLMEMQHQAKKLLQFLSTQNTEYYKVAPIQEFRKDQPEEAEFHRIRKLKDDFTSQDCVDLLQLLLPALILFVFALTAALLLASSLASYKSQLSAWLDCAQLYPQTSVALLNALLSQQRKLPQNLFQLENRFQFVALSRGLEQESLLQLLQGDSCQQHSLYQSLNISIAAFCSNASKELSLTNVLNYMTEVLHQKYVADRPDWKSLSDLVFGFVKPLLGVVNRSLTESLTALRTDCQQMALILAVMFVSLVGVASIYLLCYPLAALSQRLLFTSDLVKLLPADRERQPEQALAAMTTEAMDTF